MSAPWGGLLPWGARARALGLIEKRVALGNAAIALKAVKGIIIKIEPFVGADGREADFLNMAILIIGIPGEGPENESQRYRKHFLLLEFIVEGIVVLTQGLGDGALSDRFLVRPRLDVNDSK